MENSNLLRNCQNITLEHNKIITITHKTVRFSNNVIQTHNIVSFGEGEVVSKTLPWWIFVLGLILGLSTSSLGSFSSMGLLIILISIGGMAWNFSLRPKDYGLLLTLNSGDKTLFVTSDKKGVKKIISTIYEFLEGELNAIYQISINSSTVQGNFVSGAVGNIFFDAEGKLGQR